jgi:hypothetical protein
MSPELKNSLFISTLIKVLTIMHLKESLMKKSHIKTPLLITKTHFIKFKINPFLHQILFQAINLSHLILINFHLLSQKTNPKYITPLFIIFFSINLTMLNTLLIPPPIKIILI